MRGAAALDRTLAALADPQRRAVVDLLRVEPRRAGELAEALSLTAPAVSRHLRVLRDAAIVEDLAVDGDARVRLYQLRRGPFKALGRWVAEVEGFWSARLDAFKEHAERSHARGSR